MPTPITPTLRDLIAAWLAAQGTASIYDLIRNPVLSPPGIPNPTNEEGIIPPPIWPPTPPPTGPPPIIPPQDVGGEPEAPGEPPGWGRMDPGMERALSLGGLALGLLGSPVGMGLGALAGISRAIGGPPEPNPYADVPSLAQIDQARARTPQHVPAMMAQRQAVTDDLATMAAMMQSAAMMAQREGERTGIAPGGWDPGGWDRGIGIDGGGGDGDSGGRDAGSAGDAGTGTGAESGSGFVAKGGAFVAKQPTTKTFGEAGTEAAVFVPEWMKKPGIQGKERSIIGALETLLKQLKASAGNKKEAR